MRRRYFLTRTAAPLSNTARNRPPLADARIHFCSKQSRGPELVTTDA